MKTLSYLSLLTALLITSGCNSSSSSSSPSATNQPEIEDPVSDHSVLPGPAALYADRPAAPQLENRGAWQAEPILISGASAYRQGEFLYQDFLYDDYGAAGNANPFSQGNVAPGKAGTLEYPTDPVYANNAADLVEFRIKPGNDSTLIRVTVNTLINPEVLAFTLAIGESAAARAWPFEAGVSSPAELFLTMHGYDAVVQDAASGAELFPAPDVDVSLERRQIEVSIPHELWQPGRSTVALRLGVGLWDVAANTYAIPSLSPSATTPGGAALNGAALFNMGFRYDEPIPEVVLIPLSAEEFEASNRKEMWRDANQAAALATGNVSNFVAQVDFAKLQDAIDDESQVPTTGVLNRIYASSVEPHQGVDPAKACGRFPTDCDGQYGNQLQPYSLYVPDGEEPQSGWGLSLLLHALGQNHNAYNGSTYPEVLAHRGKGTLVMTPLSRGFDGDYSDLTELDLFEVWADVARHYPIDSDWVISTGYSMGGGGTYKMISRWPDLFAAGMGGGAVPVAEQGGQFANFSNLPMMFWVAALDEATPVNRSKESQQILTELGQEFLFDVFFNLEHLTFPINDAWYPVADFLGEHRINRNPPGIRYLRDPRFDSERVGLVADHAYWVSDMRVRDPDSDPQGLVDIFSEGFGVATCLLYTSDAADE